METTEQKIGYRTTPQGAQHFWLPGLKALREAQGLSPQQLADRAGLSTRTVVWYLESGERGAREGTINRLAQALGVSPFVLVLPPQEEDEGT